VKKIFIISIIAIIAGILCFITLILRARVPYPINIKLVDCKLSQLKFTKIIENGDNFQIILGIPSSSQLPSSFHTNVTISQSGAQILNYSVDLANIQTCNWLRESPELKAYILTWDLAPPGLDHFIQPGQTYDFVVTFSEMPPQGSSLWLSCLK
jgi:hypothetical protein